MDRERLWAWVHGEEDGPAGADAVAEHVSSCGHCASSAAEMRELVVDLEGLAGDDDAVIERDLPESIGEYRVIRKLGQGGMGVVFEAEQQAPRRRVALKVIRDPFVDEYQAHMFRREMQTLARLNHPSIAAIYDAGVSDTGQSYFAMELVDGIELNKYLHADGPSALGIRDRLRLFRRICEGVIHAHQRGVIHRDLKPSNILVGDDGIPKVLDFGLASATESDVNAVTRVSEIGRLMGTLQYMSPEQARGDGEAIDVRTDVYALGVLLYEMLTGVLPYDVSRTPLHESLRIICEKPPLNPRILNRAAPLDPATIVLKALEKDAERRYQTVAELSEDVERYLTNHPIRGRPASRWYRGRKLVERHKLATALLSIIFVTLAGGIAAVARQRDRALAGEALAQERRAEAELVGEFLTNMLASADPLQSEFVNSDALRAVLDSAAEKVEGQLTSKPRVEAPVRAAIGNAYRSLGLFESAEPHLRRALEIRRALYPQPHSDLAQSLSDWGLWQRESGALADAEQTARESLAMRRALPAADDRAIGKSLYLLGMVLFDLARYDEAEQALNESISILRTSLGDKDHETIEVKNTLAAVHVRRGHFAEAEPLLRLCVEALRIDPGPDHPNTAITIANLGIVLKNQGKLEQAEPFYLEALEIHEQRLGPDHPHTLKARYSLASLWDAQGRHQESEVLHRQVLAARRRTLGDEHPDVAASLHNLAHVLAKESKLDEAISTYREGINASRTARGQRHPFTALSMAGLGFALRDKHEPDLYPEAERRIVDALQILEAALPPAHPFTIRTLRGLRTLYGPEHLDDADKFAEIETRLQALQPPAANDP